MELDTLITNLQKFWREKKFTDLVVTVDSQDFHCHCFVLAAFSRFFRSMLHSDMREGKAGRVNLRGLTTAVFQHVLNFLYTAELSLDEGCAMDVLQAADMLDIASLKVRCAKYFSRKITTQNCLQLWASARLYDCEVLAQDARRCALKHFRLISRNPEFLDLEPNQLVSLLRDSRLSVTSEEDAFLAACQWLAHNPSAREAWMDEVMAHIRFPLIEPAVLREQVAPRVAGFRSEQCAALLHEAQEYLANPDGRHLAVSSQLEPRASSPLVASLIIIGNCISTDECFTVYAYVLRERVWRSMVRRPQLPLGCAVCPYGSGFYAAGGFFIQQVGYYDLHSLAEASCVPCADLPVGLVHHGLLAFGRRLFLFGGWKWGSEDGADDVNDSVWEYCMKKDRWRLAGKMANGDERIVAHVRDKHRIIAFSLSKGISLRYFDTKTKESANLTLNLRDIFQGNEEIEIEIEMFECCSLRDKHVIVTSKGEIFDIWFGQKNSVHCKQGRLEEFQERGFFSVVHAMDRVYILGGLHVDLVQDRETALKGGNIASDLNFIALPGPFSDTWAHASFYMNVNKSLLHKRLKVISEIKRPT